MVSSYFVFFILNLYLVSSWSNWWYASSFSQRALMQSYTVLAIPLATFISVLTNLKSSILKYAIYVFLFLLVLLNLFQSWQESKGIIHGSRMTKEYYFSVFGQTKQPSVEQKELLLVERPTITKEKFNPRGNYHLAFSEKIDFEIDNNSTIYFDNAHSGERVGKLDSLSPFSETLKKKFKDLTPKDHAWIKVSVWVYPTETWKESKLSLITTFDYKGKGYKYRGLNTEEQLTLRLNQWNKIEMDYLTPEVRTKDEMLVVYAWIRGKKPILIDDLVIDVYVKN